MILNGSGSYFAVLRIQPLFDVDPEPDFHFDTDPDPAFQFDPVPDPYRFKELMYLKQYFLHTFT